MLAHAEARGAPSRRSSASIAPNAPGRSRHERSPARTCCRGSRSSSKIVGERSTNWCIVPCPHPEWAQLVYPGLPEDEALREALARARARAAPRRAGSGGRRGRSAMGVLNDSATRLADAPLRRDSSCAGRERSLTVGMLPTHNWWAADFSTADGLRHLPNLPTEEVFTTPDPLRTQGHVTSTKPLVLRDGTIIRGLRVRFEDGIAVQIDADENVEALRSQLAIDEGALRLGELALVDRRGPHRAARHRVLQHASRRERRQPHRIRQRLPVPRRRRRRRPREQVRHCTSTS